MSSFGQSTTFGQPPIEFNCTACGRKLKVAVEAAGRQAKCPQCGSIQQVPAGNPASQSTATQLAPPGGMSNPQPGLGQTVAAPPPGQSTGQGTAGVGMPAYGQPGAASGSQMGGSQMGGQMPSPMGGAPPAGPSIRGTLTDELPSTNLPTGNRHEGADTPTRQLFEKVIKEIAKIYVGQDELVLGTLVALFSSGHVLIESVPGLGKTLFVRTLGRVLGCEFGRIQFTADLMPSDITGAPMFDMKQQEFRFRPGPVFTQLLLADEINRSPAKTHAALLEIMQEFRVTIDGVSHVLERPFLVLATQNPIESEGTYNLPEAQLDRFMFKLLAEYPEASEEAEILRLHSTQLDINKRLEEEIETVTSPEQILEITAANGEVRVEEKLIDYINKLVRLTRQWPQFHMGASPRAGLALMQAARTLAAFSGRDYAVPDDVVQIALPALRHRVILTAEAEVEGHKVDQLLTELIRSVEVPRI